MKYRKRITALILFVGTLAMAGQVGAARFQTDLQLINPVTSNNIDLVRFVHSYDELPGGVGPLGIDVLSVELFSSGTSVYFDQVILGGEVQPLPGLARTPDDVFWDYNLSTMTLSQFRNTLPSSMAPTTGTQYVVSDSIALPVDGIVGIDRYLDGAVQEAVGGQLLTQNTIRTDFSIVVIPDTQLYAQDNSPIFAAQAQWVVDNLEDDNIVYVTHLGDLKDSGGPNATISCDDVPLGGGLTEWGYVAQALSLMESPMLTGLPEGIPIGVLPGNHDFDQGQGTTTCPSFDPREEDGRPLTLYEARLGDDHFEISTNVFKSFYGGSRPPDPLAEPSITFTGDSYTLFSAGGIDFIGINLGFREVVPRAVGSTPDRLVDNPEIKWASDLLAANPDRLGIVTSHFFLWANDGENGTNEFGPWPSEVYNGLSGHRNLFMMMGAHEFGEAYRIEARSGMQPVHIMLSDYQQYRYPAAASPNFANLNGLFFPSGDSGFMRIMRFDPTNGVVDITTFAPPVSDLGRTTTLTSNYAPFDTLLADGVLDAADITVINASTSMNRNTASNLRILLDADGYLSNSVTGAAPIARAGLGVGDLLINGFSIGPVAAEVSAVTQGNNAAAAINAITSATGVEATVDAATGALTLRARDGRDIALTARIASAALAQVIQNATGLDVSAGANAAGNETRTLTLNTVPADAETIVIENRTYEFVDTLGTEASGNVGVQRVVGNLDATAANLEAAIGAEYDAGRTALVASAAGNVVTLISDLLGIETTFVIDNTGDVAVGAAAGGVAAADGDGVTTPGA